VELIALLDSGDLDYASQYRPLAVQHNLKSIEFPAEPNPSSPRCAAGYAGATVEVNGKRPGEKVRIRGEPILYALTIPNAALNEKGARALAKFILGPVGRAILRSAGQRPVVPPTSTGAGAGEIIEEAAK